MEYYIAAAKARAMPVLSAGSYQQRHSIAASHSIFIRYFWILDSFDMPRRTLVGFWHFLIKLQHYRSAATFYDDSI